MPRIVNRIVFATDFSSCSLKALEHALAWTKIFEAEITAVHVVNNYAGVNIEEAIVQVNIEEQMQVGRERLEKFVSWSKPHASHLQSELLLGIPADRICQFALDTQSDLIIMGAHGWSGLERVLMGSVAERVICQASCPVLIIPYREAENFKWADLPDNLTIETPRISSGHVLIPLDFSDCSLDAFEYATRLAKWADLSVTLLHVVEPLSYSLDFNLAHPIEDKLFRHKVESKLSELTAVLKKEKLRADYRLADKPAVDSIVNAINDTGTTLVVMGTHGRRGLSRLVMGSITAGVLRRTSSPILTVKSPKFKHEGIH